MTDDVDDRPANDGSSDAELRTFLIADVRGYTSFTQRNGDEKAAKLAAKFAQVAREVVQLHQGSVLELRGDEALCVFVSPRQAVRCAVAMQRRFVEETRFDSDLPLPVGIGIDVGEAVPVEGGYRSGALNLAARLCAIARPGEILASGEVTHLARQLDGLTYAPKDVVRLKGLAEPVRPVRVVPEGEDPVRQLVALGALPPKPASPPGPQWLPSPVRRRPRLAAVATLVVVALVAVALVVTTRGDGGPPLGSLGENAAGVLDASSGRLMGHTRVGSSPAAVTTTKDAVWVANSDDDSVSRIDITTGRVDQTTEVGESPTAIAAGGGSIWVANSRGGTVSRIDPANGRVQQTVKAGSGPGGLAFDHGTLWVVDTIGGGLLRLEPGATAAELVARVGVGPTSIAVRDDQLWVSNSGSATVVQVDPHNGDILQTAHVGNDPRGIAIVGDNLWVTNNLDATVTRVSLATASTETTRVGGGPVAVVGSADAVWVANSEGRTVSRIDPRTDRVVATLPTGAAPTALAIDGDRLWLTVANNPALHRGGTLTAASDFPVQVDTAQGYEFASEPVDAILYDGLLGLRRTGGAAGGTVVPDLAVALPTVSSDGRTYTFRLRSGVRWSTGAPVTGLDIRRGLERNVAAGVWHLYDGIVGARPCVPRKHKTQRCDFSRGVEASADSPIVRIHLTSVDPEFVYKLALPGAAAVPADTPLGPLAEDAVLPSTGPYMVESRDTEKVVLVRNPRFRVWSPAAQPAGNPDRLVFTVTPGADRGPTWSPPAVDWVTTFGVPDPDALSARLGERFQAVVQPATQYVFLNANGPPFDQPKARAAVAYAIDRRAAVSDWNSAGEVACQILPPSIPGYEPYCPYTLHPNDRGDWTSPDVLKGRKLLRQSGMTGTHVTVYAPSDVTGMEHVVTAMNTIGLVARLHTFDPDTYFSDVQALGDRAQAGFTGWGADYPAASNFFQPQLSCAGGGNFGRYCDPALDREMAAVARLQVKDPVAALARWTRIDHEVTDAAPLVPLIVPIGADVHSNRLGHHARNIILGPLFAQAWVR